MTTDDPTANVKTRRASQVNEQATMASIQTLPLSSLTIGEQLDVATYLLADDPEAAARGEQILTARGFDNFTRRGDE